MFWSNYKCNLKIRLNKFGLNGKFFCVMLSIFISNSVIGLVGLWFYLKKSNFFLFFGKSKMKFLVLFLMIVMKG